MTDRADEIAKDFVRRYVDALEELGWAADDGIPDGIRESMAKQLAIALRSYGNERLEAAADHLDMSGTTSPSQSMEPAAKLVRCFKSNG